MILDCIRDASDLEARHASDPEKTSCTRTPVWLLVGQSRARRYWETMAVPELMGHVARLMAVPRHTIVATVWGRTGAVGREALDSEKR